MWQSYGPSLLRMYLIKNLLLEAVVRGDGNEVEEKRRVCVDCFLTALHAHVLIRDFPRSPSP